MSRTSSIRRLFGSAGPASKTVRRSRLAVEALEDRLVPTLNLPPIEPPPPVTPIEPPPLTITIVNEKPTDIALINDSVAENQPAGTVVGAFSTTDLLDSGNHTYTLVSGDGDTDNA